jgi:hypothetical protein
MSLKEVWYKCPECHKAFSLKGTKLKLWLKRKKDKPNAVGPFCSFKCSGKHNIKKARKHKKAKNKAK